MSSVLATLLPEILASVLYPAWILFTVLLLMGQNGVKRVLALTAGGTLTRLIQIVLFGFIFGESPNAEEASGYGASPIASTLFLFVGIFFLITCVKAYLNEPDPDAPPSKLAGMIDGLSPSRVFLLGAGWVLISPKLWAFTLSAISTVSYANLSQTENILVYLIFLIGCVLFSLIVVIMSVLQPEKTRGVMERFRLWLDRNMRTIKIVVSAIFGVLFIYIGITGLIG